MLFKLHTLGLRVLLLKLSAQVFLGQNDGIGIVQIRSCLIQCLFLDRRIPRCLFQLLFSFQKLVGRLAQDFLGFRKQFRLLFQRPLQTFVARLKTIEFYGMPCKRPGDLRAFSNCQIPFKDFSVPPAPVIRVKWVANA